FERRLGPAAGAAHQRVDARQQFLDVERLDQIVVGAVLQALDLVLPARARGQDQDREALAGIAQFLDQVHARLLRQAQVDDGDVERHLAAEVQAFFAVGRGIDREAVALQARGERFTQWSFVFDQEYAHDDSLFSKWRNVK